MENPLTSGDIFWREENLGAVNLELTGDDLREIDAETSRITVHGNRYPESAQRMIDR